VFETKVKEKRKKLKEMEAEVRCLSNTKSWGPLENFCSLLRFFGFISL
jgi:hypothetical protein